MIAAIVAIVASVGGIIELLSILLPNLRSLGVNTIQTTANLEDYAQCGVAPVAQPTSACGAFSGNAAFILHSFPCFRRVSVLDPCRKLRVSFSLHVSHLLEHLSVLACLWMALTKHLGHVSNRGRQ